MEPFYPLHAYVCDGCFLVQVRGVRLPREIFTEYAYFSSYADSWVEHMRRYAEMIAGETRPRAKQPGGRGSEQRRISPPALRSRQIPVLGIEPAANVAKVAIEKGVPTRVAFFGAAIARDLATKGRERISSAAPTCSPRCPIPTTSSGDMKILLKPGGTITVEFPHPDEAHR